jgi:hypothetical protein
MWRGVLPGRCSVKRVVSNAAQKCICFYLSALGFELYWTAVFKRKGNKPTADAIYLLPIQYYKH